LRQEPLIFINPRPAIPPISTFPILAIGKSSIDQLLILLLEQAKKDMHDLGPALRTEAEPAFLEHFQHRDIIR
jgi:hypothetical protein